MVLGGIKLTELAPRFYVLEKGGPIVGLSFMCPHCEQIRLAVAFHHSGHAEMDDRYIKAFYPDSNENIWNLEGQENFETLTLAPSIDASAHGHWHGNITDGRCQ